jgi:hypothetical protein
MNRLLFIILLPLILLGGAKAESLGQVIQSVYNRGVYFDQDRFDTVVIMDFANDTQELIATIGKTNQAETTIVLGDDLSYALPSDFYLIHSVIINADPTLDSDSPRRRRKSLKYVPYEDFGNSYAVGSDRPADYSIWADSVKLHKGSDTGEDSLFVGYFRHATAMTDTADAVDLPQAYIAMLKDIVIQMCLNRITFPNQSPKEEALTLTAMVTEALLGRRGDQ